MRKDEQGFSLIELLIAMSLMVIITGFLIYMWVNTVQTMRFAQSAVTAHTQGRRIIRMLTETIQNTSGCHPLLAGNTGPSGIEFSAHFAGIDSYTVDVDPGTGDAYARTRGFKWGVAHRDADGNLYHDFSTELPTFGSSVVHAYASPFATGLWVAGREVFLGQTVVPNISNASNSYDGNRVYRSIISGRLNARDTTHTAATTGTREPTWPTGYGETVQDGNVIWMCVPPYLHVSPIHIPGSETGRLLYADVTGGAVNAAMMRSVAVDTSRRVGVFASNVGGLQTTLSSTVDANLVFASEAARNSHFALIPEADRIGVQIRVTDIDEYQLWEWNMDEGTGEWRQVFSGLPEPIDPGGIYTGFRGVRPQGRGYRPHAATDTDNSLHPLTPRWVRVDFSVTGDVRPGIDDAELPRFSFTHMMLLR